MAIFKGVESFPGQLVSSLSSTTGKASFGLDPVLEASSISIDHVSIDPA